MAYNASNISMSPRGYREPTNLHHPPSDPSSRNLSTPRTVSSLSRTRGADAQVFLNEPNLGFPPTEETGLSVDAANRLRYRVFGPWKCEIISLGLCIGTNVAMFVILARYNRKHVPSWGYSVNLNTILSILSTVQRAALLSLLTSMISQAKWVWFGDQPRPLQDLHVMDFASRSIWCAISVMPLAVKTNPRILAMILIMILSLGIGPFTQQAIGTEPCPELAPGLAMIPLARYVYCPFKSAASYPQPPSDIETNIYSSLMDPAGPVSNLRYQCTTGNCTFDTHGDPINSTDFDWARVFSTMGLCHKCVNVSHLISSERKVQNTGKRYLVYSLPNVHYDGFEEEGGLQSIRIYDNGISTAVFRSVFSNLTWAANAIPQDVQDLSTSSIANITILACNNKRCNGQKSDICASTCVLYPCIRSYTVSITNGELVQEQVSTSPTIASGWVQDRRLQGDYEFPSFGDSKGFPVDWMAAKSPCRIGDRIYTLQNISSGSEPSTTWSCVNGTDTNHRGCESMANPQYCLYRQDNGHGQAVSSVLSKYFTQYCVYQDDVLKCNNYPSVIQENVANVMFQRGNITTKAIDEYFGAVAISISNQYRNNYGRIPPKPWVAAAEDPPFGEVDGVVLQTKTCNTIHLQWLAFPTAITAITAGILLWSIIESWGKRRHRPIWKDHILPFLFYSHRFKGGVNDSTVTEEGHDDVRIWADGNERLLETDEMEKLAVQLQVRFQWPGDQGTKGEILRKRSSGLRNVDVDSLLQE